MSEQPAEQTEMPLVPKQGPDDASSEENRPRVGDGEDCRQSPSAGTRSAAEQAEINQNRELESGEENPG